MKNANSLEKSPFGNDFRTVVESTRNKVIEALLAVDDARHKCLAAGQALLEAKTVLTQPRNGGRFAEVGEAGFEEWVEKTIPEITVRTARNWMRAAANVLKALPPASGVIDVEATPVSEILTMPEDELSEGAREWRQQWLDFTENKTIRECLAGVFVDGDEDHRIDRAVNGKVHGGAGGDRKDFPLFVAVKFKDMGTHLSHWEGMSQVQRTETLEVVRAAILGDQAMLRGRERKAFTFAAWPEEVCRVAIETLRERLKRGNGA